MKKSLQKNIKAGLVIALSLAIGIAFMPLNTSNVYATNFSDGKISGYKMSARTYKSVTFVWNSYPGASGYEVYRAFKKGGKYTKLKTTTSTYIKRTGLTLNRTCYYKVRAYKKSNGKKIYTKFTAGLAGTPRLSTPSVSATSSTSGIYISWPAVSGASGYELYRAASAQGSYSKVKTLKSNAYSDTSTAVNKPYYYKVRAYRTVSGKKKYSYYGGIPMGMKASITKVSSVSAASQSNYIGLSWAPVSGASGYEVYRATGSSSGSYTNVGNAAGAAFNDYNVAYGLTYFYRVRAYKTVGNARIYGDFSSVGFSRNAVVSTAVAWLGCKESNKSNKPIVDLYNSNMGTKFSYTTPWCAIFVSAVAIKSGTTSIIVRGSYCPSVINAYKNSKVSNYKYGAGANYVPKAGDVIFFDWNRNGVPDHTGLVASVSGNTIKTIEGNYSDAVGYRTFSVGYKYVQGYGLPNYDDANGILFTGSNTSSVGCGELAAMGIGTEPEGIEELKQDWDNFRQFFGKVGAVIVQTASDLINMIISPIKTLIGWIQSVFNWAKTAVQQLNEFFKANNARAQRIQNDGSIYLQGFAAGGFPDVGQLFIARENGPEMVGTMAGQTAVANNDQIVDGIRQGVFEAVMQAYSANDRGDTVWKIDGEVLARIVTKYQRFNAISANL